MGETREMIDHKKKSSLRWRNVRPFFLKLHRYTGLFLALFLIVEGVTGSISVFRDEIDAFLNPSLFSDPSPKSRVLPVSTLVDVLKVTHPSATLQALTFRPEKGRNGRAFFQPLAAQEPMQEVFFNPHTGHVVGERLATGTITSVKGVIPFVYNIHATLACGTWGTFFLGIIALIWIGDCVSGLVLTLPISITIWKLSFWRQWRKILWIHPYKSLPRLIFDLHRAPALWLWGLLLGMAVSGVALALGPVLFQPVIQAIFPSAPTVTCAGDHSAGHRLAVGEAEHLVRVCAQHYGIEAGPSGAMFLDHEQSILFYIFSETGREVSGLGSPLMLVDTRSNNVTFLTTPQNRRAADVILQMQDPWHSGRLLGVWGRIIVCVTGGVTFVLSITGIYIFIIKNRRKKNPQKHIS